VACRSAYKKDPSPALAVAAQRARRQRVGEGGAVAPPAAIANAVYDALAPFGVEVNSTRIKPEQLVRATRPR
jgi:hypothetical protein